jgi:hypothetical protein
MNSEYKVLTTKECMEYIQQNKIDLQNNNWDYSIPSGKGIIYTLPNGEFVLVPSNLMASYPGIIFKSVEIFKKFLNKDSFPIAEEDMSWLELHGSEIDSLGKRNPPAYKSISEIEIAYNQLLQFIGESENSNKTKESAVYLFGLSVIDFLLHEGTYTVRLQKRYATYNHYYYPLLVKDGIYVDLLTDLRISLQKKDKDSFNFFANPLQLSK